MVEGQSAIDLLAPTLHVAEFVFQKKSQTLSVKVSRVFEVDIRYKIKKKKIRSGLVAYTYNLSFRSQEEKDHDSEPAWAM